MYKFAIQYYTLDINKKVDVKLNKPTHQLQGTIFFSDGPNNFQFIPVTEKKF